MRVFVRPPPNLSRAMTRVSSALSMYAPIHIQVVPKIEDAQLVVLHAIGYPDTVSAIFECKNRGQRFAILQYCLRSTQRPNTQDWIPLWERAALVYSYFDLFEACDEDAAGYQNCQFYVAPLGVDPLVFGASTISMEQRQFTILTSGYVAETECAQEAADAVKAVGGKMFHLGPEMNLGLTNGQCRFELDIDDGMLARAYRTSKFVAGLRRAEGFELPAAEGLFCGARPIVFDRPHYRRWFNGFAEFIPERDPEVVTAALVSLFEQGARPVSVSERECAVLRFSWEGFANGFWGRIRT